MPEFEAWNKQIIEEFRATGGTAEAYKQATLVLLHTTGAKSGAPRVNPLVALLDGEDIVVFGTNAGRPIHPAWYYNLLAHPRTRVELGDEVIEVQARVAEGPERERLWALQVQRTPSFEDKARSAGREIPVVVLERV